MRVYTCDCWISLSRDRGCVRVLSRMLSSPRFRAFCCREWFKVRSSNTTPCSCSIYTQTHTHIKSFKVVGALVISVSDEWELLQHRIHISPVQLIFKGQPVSFTSDSFSFSAVCSSDSLSLSLSLSVRSLSLSSSEDFSCTPMCDSRSSKTLFCVGGR